MKTAVIEVSMKLELTGYPDNWDQQQFEFHFSESSWCKGNLDRKILEVLDRKGFCLCEKLGVKVLEVK